MSLLATFTQAVGEDAFGQSAGCSTPVLAAARLTGTIFSTRRR